MPHIFFLVSELFEDHDNFVDDVATSAASSNGVSSLSNLAITGFVMGSSVALGCCWGCCYFLRMAVQVKSKEKCCSFYTDFYYCVLYRDTGDTTGWMRWSSFSEPPPSASSWSSGGSSEAF